MTSIAYVITVTDGATLRTIHPAALGSSAADVERILRAHLFSDAQPSRAVPPTDTGTLTQREIATSQGFTGDACPNCGGFMMKRAGTCLTCQACGSTTGCG
ncbi:hypothetical protein [Methylobacterium sp. J-068]|uniref:hypothetical protein n=1 Tax=Methylobacterium sp. J-068 TaxID=2836649 RepID=UPI001FB8639B|nr:hypothetical protein [Methylobacterium sp. J-068]MCJ2035255.1 hypothetical protein [Methylobacterium sp. J-068]